MIRELITGLTLLMLTGICFNTNIKSSHSIPEKVSICELDSITPKHELEQKTFQGLVRQQKASIGDLGLTTELINHDGCSVYLTGIEERYTINDMVEVVGILGSSGAVQVIKYKTIPNLPTIDNQAYCFISTTDKQGQIDLMGVSIPPNLQREWNNNLREPAQFCVLDNQLLSLTIQ